MLSATACAIWHWLLGWVVLLRAPCCSWPQPARLLDNPEAARYLRLRTTGAAAAGAQLSEFCYSPSQRWRLLTSRPPSSVLHKKGSAALFCCQISSLAQILRPKHVYLLLCRVCTSRSLAPASLQHHPEKGPEPVVRRWAPWTPAPRTWPGPSSGASTDAAAGRRTRGLPARPPCRSRAGARPRALARAAQPTGAARARLDAAGSAQVGCR